MKVTFTKDFDFSPDAFKGMVDVAYQAGTTVTVTRECAEKAQAAGAIEPLPETAPPVVDKTAP